MKRRDLVVLNKIIEEAEVITRIVSGLNENDFLSDDMRQRAVGMTLINIGELVKGLTNDLRQSHAYIPWKRIAGLRDIAVHGYATLDMRDIWNTSTNAIPSLVYDIKEILVNQEEAG